MAASEPSVGPTADNAPHPPPGVSWTVTAARHQAPEGYVAIDHDLIDDHRLSWAARGLLFEMLSYPPDWTATGAELMRGGPESLAELMEALTELQAVGFVKQVRL